MQPPNGYYSAEVARRMLGDITNGMFYSYVKRGDIRKHIPPGRRQAFYNKSDVQKLARLLNDLPNLAQEEVRTHFSMATEKDMPEIVDLLISLFGGSNTTGKRLDWMKKNPEIAYLIRSKEEVVGCVFVLPLTYEKIQSILSDPTSGSTRLLAAGDIQPYIPGVPVYLYIVSMCVKPGVTPTAKRVRGQFLLRGMFRVFENLGKRGIPIELLAARSESLDGIHLLRHIGFTEIESPTHLSNFIIEVPRSGISHIMRYKRALAQYKLNVN